MKIRDERSEGPYVRLDQMHEGEPFEWNGDLYMRSGALSNLPGDNPVDVIMLEPGEPRTKCLMSYTPVLPLECELVITGVRT